MTARNIARPDSNDAEPSRRDLVPRRRIRDRRPSFGFRGLARQECDPPCQDDQRRVTLDPRVAERMHPLLHDGHLTGAVGGQDQCGDQLDTPITLGRVQQVLDGQAGGAARLVPVGGAKVQLGDDLRFDALQLTEQELPEQTVVAIPLAATVERDHEQARGLELAELGLCIGPQDDGIAQRARHLIEHRCTPQEALHVFGLAGQRLAVEVVGHVRVFTADRRRLATVLSGDHGGEVEARRPSLGASHHRGGRGP